MSFSQRILLTVILIAAAGLRIHFDNVPLTGLDGGDEKVYTADAIHLVDFGWSDFPALNRAFVADPAKWIYPHPLRWGYLAMTVAAVRLSGWRDPRAIAGLATCAGIASVGLTFLVGLELFGADIGLTAAALSLTSPLQLALGRRALQDEVFCAATLLVIWLVLRVLRAEPARSIGLYAAAVAAGALALSVKESFFLVYPALLGLLLVRGDRRRLVPADALLFALPPLINYLGYSACSRSFREFFRIARIVIVHNAHVPYAMQYQSGPPQRVLVDMIALSPTVMLCAIGATALILARVGRPESGARRLVAAFVLLLAVFSFFPSKNLRYIVSADPLARLLMAWALMGYAGSKRKFARTIFIAVFVFNAAAELAVFRTVFVVNEVYDPVTERVFRALRMLPRPQ